jgi:hypothetical protein
MDSIQPDILNDISTNVGLNVFFFVIFIVFAISFFGYFELALPESWTNKASSAEGVGGILGIFFMALTLALVSFSCTGPILGSLLAGTMSSSSGAMQLTVGMGGFGLALALPFGLFAAFPGLLNRLPKSGGWMNSVKVVLGFLELALALKFLSNADLVKHWGLVKIEIFLGLWIIIFSALALYLFGVIRIGHESKKDKRSLTHKILGFASILFVAYLVSGFRFDERAGTYKSLTALSGMAPPTCYSLVYDCDCPHNLNCFKDLRAMYFVGTNIDALQGLEELRKLEEIEMAAVKYTKFPNTFKVAHLKRLSIVNTISMRAVPVEICTMTGLISLALFGNQISEALPKCLANLKLLEHWTLDGNSKLSLQHLNIDMLKSMISLKQFQLLGTSLNVTDKQNLQQALPGVQIY